MTAPTVEDAERATALAARARAAAARAERELNNGSSTSARDAKSCAEAATRAARAQLLMAEAEEAEVVANEMWELVPGGFTVRQMNALAATVAVMGTKMGQMMEVITGIAKTVTAANVTIQLEEHMGATDRAPPPARATIPLNVEEIFSREKVADASTTVPPMNALAMARTPLETLTYFQAELRGLAAAGLFPPQHAQLLNTALTATIEAAGGPPPSEYDAKRVARLHEIAAGLQARAARRLHKGSKAAEKAAAKHAPPAAAAKKAGSRPSGAEATAAAPSAPSGRDPKDPWGKGKKAGGGTAARGAAAERLPGAAMREAAQAAETPAAAAAKAGRDAATALYEAEAARVRSTAELLRSQEAALEAEAAAKAARERTSALEAAAAAREREREDVREAEAARVREREAASQAAARAEAARAAADAASLSEEVEGLAAEAAEAALLGGDDSGGNERSTLTAHGVTLNSPHAAASGVGVLVRLAALRDEDERAARRAAATAAAGSGDGQGTSGGGASLTSRAGLTGAIAGAVTVATGALRPAAMAALKAVLGQRKVFLLNADGNGLSRIRPATPRTPAVPLVGRTINLDGGFGGAFQEFRLFASPLAATADGSPATLQLGMTEQEAFEAVEEETGAAAAGADGGESGAEAAADEPETPPPPRTGGVRTRSLGVRTRSFTAAEAAAPARN